MPALVRLERWEALSADARRSLAPLCPDLVVELASPSDGGPRRFSALRRKMADDQGNGARLGWLLLPGERAVEVWSSAGEPQRLDNPAEFKVPQGFSGLSLHLC